MPKHGSINLYVHGNQKAREDGQPRTSTSTLTQLLNYGACSTQLFKPLFRTACYFQGVFTAMVLICVVVVCIYMCVKIILPYYSVTAQFK